MSAREAELLATLQKRPTDTLARYVLAKDLFDEGRHDEAIPHFRLILERKPDWMKCHIHLGQSLLALGQTEAARPVLEQALALAHSQHHEGPAGEIAEILRALG